MIAVIVLGTLVALHGPLLRSAGRFLIVDRAAQQADYAALLPATADDRSCVEEAARLYAQRRVRGVLLFEPVTTRAVRAGALPELTTVVRRELAARGVPVEMITVLPGPSHDAWDAARSLQAWLRGREDIRLIVLCPRFRGREERRIMETVLPTDEAVAVSYAAPQGPIDENNWWRSREGIQILFSDYVRLAFVVCNGESPPCVGQWTMEQFERRLPKSEAGK